MGGGLRIEKSLSDLALLGTGHPAGSGTHSQASTPDSPRLRTYQKEEACRRPAPSWQLGDHWAKDPQGLRHQCFEGVASLVSWWRDGSSGWEQGGFSAKDLILIHSDWVAYKQYKFIFHSSGGWEVQEQGPGSFCS